MVMESEVVRGKVVRFESSKGYGFIAPEGGGDDVFVHAKELEVHGQPVGAGTAVEFKVLDTGRGPKAYDVHLLGNGTAGGPSSVMNPFTATRHDNSDDECEVLSERNFTREVTELIIKVSPGTTGAQIAEIRTGLCELARGHGWVE